MIKVESACVGCKDLGLPCMGESCPNYEEHILCCDECGDECDELFVYEGSEICEDCLKKQFERVTLKYL